MICDFCILKTEIGAGIKYVELSLFDFVRKLSMRYLRGLVTGCLVVGGGGLWVTGGNGRCVTGGNGRCVTGGNGRCVTGGNGRIAKKKPIMLELILKINIIILYSSVRGNTF